MGTTVAKSTFRPEIEGIRAVAALLVAIYHIWLGRVSGGVDVFFVVASFLLTTSLIARIEAAGAIDFAHFWGRLLKRLLPAALTVLGVVIVASILWLPKVRWSATIKEVSASTVYFENWWLAVKSVDYLARDEELSPVQHYWALSVQGQIYFLWPLLIALGALIAARGRWRLRPTYTVLFAAIFVASLAYAQISIRVDQAFAYFDTFARLWEFSLGALFALLLPRLILGRAARVVLGWAGLIAIVVCGLVFQVSTSFPGYAALWPTVAAAMVIAAGASGSPLGADRLLGSRPLVYLGGIAYAIYLWHWPIVVFYRLLVGRTSLGLAEGAAIIGLSIVLADLTTRFIERPIRTSIIGTYRPWQAFALAGSGLAVVVTALAAWSLMFFEARQFDHRPIAVNDPNYPGAQAAEEDFVYRGADDVPFYPGPLAVREDLPKLYADGCQQTRDHAEPIRCVYGAPDAPRTIALVGGSHSAHWFPALEAIAHTHNWEVVVYTKVSCRFGHEIVTPDGKVYPSCQEWNERVLEELKNDPPELVFTTATAGTGGEERVPAEFLEVWRELADVGVAVVAVRDNPWMVHNVAECVELRGSQSSACMQPRTDMLADVNPVDELPVRPPNVRFIDLSEYFCDATHCKAVVGNVLIYRDDNHLTTAYARTLTPILLRELGRVVPQFGPWSIARVNSSPGVL